MKATLDCLECIAAQALRAARVVAEEHEVQRKILNETVKRIPEFDLEKSPAELSLIAYELASELSGNPDGYRELRREQNEFALRLEPELRELVRNSEDPLITALHLAAAGNVIDLGVAHSNDIDVRAAIEQVMSERFAIDHTEAFLESLGNSKDLVFLLDNAGEIVFDKILIEELLGYTNVTAVVKAGPISLMVSDSVIDGTSNCGRLCGIPPNALPMVATPSKSNTQCSVVATTMATSGAGTRFR